MRILVTGSREWAIYHVILLALLDATMDCPPDEATIITGGALGADELAGLAASIEGWNLEVHPAEWAKHGKAAGPIRNQEMVDAGADLCLAFFKPGAANRGTRDCVDRAKRAGIPVRMYPGEGDREPSGGSSGSPATPGPGVPGGSDDYLPVALAGDDPADLRENITPVSPEEFMPDFPIAVFGAGGTAYVEPISEYYRKRQ